MSSLYRALMFVGHLWCHQMPERSPHLWGVQMPLCWRCGGILLGSLALLGWLMTRRQLPPVVLSLVLAATLPLDVLHAAVTQGPGDNARRLATGLLWGFFGTGLALHAIGLIKSALSYCARRQKC